MKNYILSLILLLHFAPLPAQDIIRFTISTPANLLTFLQAGNNDPDVSATLCAYVHEHVPPEDTAAFRQLINEFSSISFGYSYTIPGYPDARLWPRTVFNQVSIAAIQAYDNDEFMRRIIGLLPNEDWLKLKKIMTQAGPYYDKVIGQTFKAAQYEQLVELERYTDETRAAFNKLTHFYGSTWTADIPFTVCIYVVPGRKGNTTATPHSNSILLGVMAGETDHAISLTQAIHEMCHMLYLEQGRAAQQLIDGYFVHNKSPYALYAYGYFDEALATACGNGWSYNLLTSNVLPGSWYANEYINGYGHAIYPMVKRYIETDRTIDKQFVDSAILLFEHNFPGAMLDYTNLLNNVTVYTDAADHEQFNTIMQQIQQQYTAHTSGGTYPIADPQSVDMMKHTAGTQLFVIHTNFEKNCKVLNAQFPQLKTLLSHDESIISFFDEKKRPVIILNVHNAGRLGKALSVMQQTKAINPARPVVPIR